MEAMHYQTLMERQRVERDSYHPTLGMRVHQALSWLSRAEQADDLDGRFIFLWIAFNAAYATEIEGSNHLPGQSIFVDFLSTSARINKCFNASRGLLDYPFSKLS